MSYNEVIEPIGQSIIDFKMYSCLLSFSPDVSIPLQVSLLRGYVLSVEVKQYVHDLNTESIAPQNKMSGENHRKHG